MAVLPLFLETFFRCFLVAVLGALLDGFWKVFGVIFEAFSYPWMLRFVWPLLYQNDILVGQI